MINPKFKIQNVKCQQKKHNKYKVTTFHLEPLLIANISHLFHPPYLPCCHHLVHPLQPTHSFFTPPTHAFYNPPPEGPPISLEIVQRWLSMDGRSDQLGPEDVKYQFRCWRERLYLWQVVTVSPSALAPMNFSHFRIWVTILCCCAADDHMLERE